MKGISMVSDQFFSRLEGLLTKITQNLGYLLWDILVVALILLLAKVALELVSRLTSSAMKRKAYHVNEYQGKRVDTMMTLLRSIARYMIYFTALLLILQQFGLGKPMENLLMTAGIGSLAIGFGAQNLVKDVVTGFFMMFENQFSVGDYIKTEDSEGTVTATAMRVTYLRSLKGDQIIVPNGSITRVINYTRSSYVAAITVSTAYEADTRQVLHVIDQAVQAYAKEHEDLVIEPPFVQGITNFGDSSVDIGVICKVQPMKQWEVERGMRLAIKELFDELGVEFPYPHMVTVPYTPASTAPLDLVDNKPEEELPAPEWADIDEELGDDAEENNE